MPCRTYRVLHLERIDKPGPDAANEGAWFAGIEVGCLLGPTGLVALLPEQRLQVHANAVTTESARLTLHRHNTMKNVSLISLVITVAIVGVTTYLGGLLFNNAGQHWGSIGGALLGGILSDVSRLRRSK